MEKTLKGFVVLYFRGQKYNVVPSFSLIEEIELEFGAVTQIIQDIKKGNLKVTDIVTITHMILAYIKIEIDYRELGEEVVNSGASNFVMPIYRILDHSINGNSRR